MNKIIVLLLLCFNVSFAQTTTANLKSVSEDGLYIIKLPQQIRSFSKQDLGDLRIFDSKNQETPYFIFEKENQMGISDFESLKIISNHVILSKNTQIIFENSSLISNELILEIANTQAVKNYSISGSNSQKNWFGLINKENLFLENSSNTTSVFSNLKIPYNSYKYIKIEFDDSKTLPINVLKVGVMKSYVTKNNLEKVIPKKTTISQDKENKTTTIKIDFSNQVIINQLALKISNPKLYRRNAQLFTKENITYKKKLISQNNVILDFELDSSNNNSFFISEIFTNQLFITISNNDNIPLSIAEISFFQNQKSIISELKANEIYTLKTGNSKLFTPNYDIKYFENTLQKNLPETQIINIKQLEKTSKSTENTKKTFWSEPLFLWICIAIGAIVALYFTTKLVADMKKMD